MSGNLFSLVLASATGWALLLLGGLPVATLRRLPAEPLKAVGAWALVAATAPAAIFHWYLIFAVICLVACTKLERPAGKIWLAVPAALGLSLGLIFPLETSLALSGLKNPAALALLYLGGAIIGQAYLIVILAQEMTSGRALWLVLSAFAWAGLLATFFWRFSLHPSSLGPPVAPRFAVVWPAIWPPLLVLVLALLTWNAARRQKLKLTRGLAIATLFAAGVASLLDLSRLPGAEAGPQIF